MKGIWILAGVAVAGTLVLLRPGEDPALPRTQDAMEEVGVSPAPQPEPSRTEVQLPVSPAVIVLEPKPTDVEEIPVTHEATPEWINEASFVAAGLSREQAAELVEGMRILHDLKQRLGAEGERSSNSSVLHGLMMLKLGPSLADHIKDGSIQFRWAPRLRPLGQFAGNSFASDADPASKEPWSYSAHGRVGFLSLEIPRELCDTELWKRLAAASADK